MEDCLSYYEINGGNTTKINMLSYSEEVRLKKSNITIFSLNNSLGIQRWKVPKDGVYT